MTTNLVPIRQELVRDRMVGFFFYGAKCNGCIAEQGWLQKGFNGGRNLKFSGDDNVYLYRGRVLPWQVIQMPDVSSRDTEERDPGLLSDSAYVVKLNRKTEMRFTERVVLNPVIQPS